MVKVIIAVSGLIVMRIVMSLTTHYLGRYVRYSQTCYRTRKIVTLGVYLM
jgi:membrane protein YqaA with SNARE-associated domain